MIALAPPPPVSLLEALRGDRSGRPPLDTVSAAGLRAQLEDGIYEIVGSSRSDVPIVVRSSTLRQASRTTNLNQSSSGQLRGVLVNQLLRLLSVGAEVEHAFDDATSAWRAESDGGDLIALWDGFDDSERARLATDVTAHAVTLTRALGTIPRRWAPRTAVRASQRLAGGQVILRDVIDLVVGSTADDVASIVLFDVTTSPLGEGAERVLRYHALVQTLRTSMVPLRSAMFSTATGELWLRDVDHEQLTRSVHEVLAVIAEQWTER